MFDTSNQPLDGLLYDYDDAKLTFFFHFPFSKELNKKKKNCKSNNTPHVNASISKKN